MLDDPHFWLANCDQLFAKFNENSTEGIKDHLKLSKIKLGDLDVDWIFS